MPLESGRSNNNLQPAHGARARRRRVTASDTAGHDGRWITGLLCCPGVKVRSSAVHGWILMGYAVFDPPMNVSNKISLGRVDLMD